MSLPRGTHRKVFRALTPQIVSFVKTIIEVKREDSDGGRYITQTEYKKLYKEMQELLDSLLEVLGITVKTRQRKPKEEPKAGEE